MSANRPRQIPTQATLRLQVFSVIPRNKYTHLKKTFISFSVFVENPVSVFRDRRIERVRTY